MTLYLVLFLALFTIFNFPLRGDVDSFKNLKGQQEASLAGLDPTFSSVS